MENHSKSPKLKLTVGLCGVSCGGKTTLSQLILSHFPWAKMMHQDNYFQPNEPQYHEYLEEIDYFNWELLSAINFERMKQTFRKIAHGETTETETDAEKPNFFPNSALVKNLQPPPQVVKGNQDKFSSIEIILVEGHCIFNNAEFHDLCQFDLRYFFTLSEEECRRRRAARNYNPPNPEGFFDLCVWPSFLSRFEQVKQMQMEMSTSKSKSKDAQIKVQFMDADAMKIEEMFIQIYEDMIQMMEKMLVEDEKNNNNNNS